MDEFLDWFCCKVGLHKWWRQTYRMEIDGEVATYSDLTCMKCGKVISGLQEEE